MKPLPHNADLLGVAPRVVWFEPPERALADPVRFLTYLMTYGTIKDIAVVRRYVELEISARPSIARRRASWTSAPGPIGMP
jgi:hypothetical protein